MERRITQIIRILILLGAFTPLVIFRLTWSPTNFGKMIVFRIIIEVALALWGIKKIRQMKLSGEQTKTRLFKLRSDLFGGSRSGLGDGGQGLTFLGFKIWSYVREAKISFALIVFGVSFAVSTFLGAHIGQSFWGGFERMGGLREKN